MFGVDLDLLVQINKKRYPTLLSSSKLKKDTCIELPPPDMRWILTKQISKNKPEGKKKRVYSVQVVLFAPCRGRLLSTGARARRSHARTWGVRRGVSGCCVCACETAGYRAAVPDIQQHRKLPRPGLPTAI